MASFRIKLPPSGHIGLKVLICDPEARRGAEHEAQAESDPELARIAVYTASKISEARILARQHGIELCIYPDPFDGQDFVGTQIELHNANKNLNLIPLIATTTLRQLRESIRISQVTDYADVESLGSYAALKQLILDYVRVTRNPAHVLESQYGMADMLASALLTTKQDWAPVKPVSHAFLEKLLKLNDLDPFEIGAAVAFNKLFFWDIPEQNYDGLLNGYLFKLRPLLGQVGSPIFKKAPSSTVGLAITLANFLAWGHATALDPVQIMETIAVRPDFLNYPSLRGYPRSLLESLLAGGVAASRTAS